MMPRAFVLVLVLASLILPSAASAGARRYAIGEIRVEGDVGERERHDVEESAWRTLALLLPTDATLAPDDAVRRALNGRPELRGCGDDRCMLALGDGLGVERIITLRIEKRDGGWTARLLDYAVDAAQVAGTLELPCPGCDATALFDRLGRAFTSMLAAEATRPLCKLQVSSQPPSGVVAVDAVPLGRVPFAHTIAAGRHTITVDAPEFARGQAEIDCPAAGAQDLAFTLSADHSVVRQKDRGGPRAAFVGAGATSLALAGLAVAGLAVAGVYDGRPACDDSRCAFRYDTGIAIGVSAAAVVVFGVGGVTLLALGARRTRF
jgi:hypothetical protein